MTKLFRKVVVIGGSIEERWIEFYKPKEGWGAGYFMAWDDKEVRVHYGPTMTVLNLKPSRDLKWYVRKHLGSPTAFDDPKGLLDYVPYEYVREEYLSRPVEERRLRMSRHTNNSTEEEQ